MSLIIYYLAFIIVGDIVAYLLGFFTERVWGSYPSLVVFLALYFLSLWVAWILAIRVTQPKTPALKH